MKNTALLLLGFIMFAITAKAGGNDPCDCNKRVEMYAPGVALWVSSTQIKCSGEEGTCWKVDFQGGWVLTIYVEPPIVLRNNRPLDNPPAGPTATKYDGTTTTYDFDPNTWKKEN